MPGTGIFMDDPNNVIYMIGFRNHLQLYHFGVQSEKFELTHAFGFHDGHAGVAFLFEDPARRTASNISSRI